MTYAFLWIHAQMESGNMLLASSSYRCCANSRPVVRDSFGESCISGFQIRTIPMIRIPHIVNFLQRSGTATHNDENDRTIAFLIAQRRVNGTKHDMPSHSTTRANPRCIREGR